ncbi:MAG TPA: phosphate regulon sensor histidine kinase PhoR [Burkholderiales bacterium]|nr:phosphate regulon sensor histidine kinase PhoR [Burkholderiales bacterium]
MPRLKPFWGRPLSTLALLGFVSLLGWLFLGGTVALAMLAALLLALLLHHLHQLSALYWWLKDPRIDTVPAGRGAWAQLFSYLVRMLRRQQQSESMLHQALSRFQLAGSALPEAVVLLDEADRMEWCNPRAEDYFGLRLARDRGQQITYILRQPQFAEHLGSGQISEPLVLRVTHDQGECVLSVQLVPYGDREKLLLGRDITRWERLETTRRDFVANVSHELRTPLTVVHGFLETLEDMREPDPQMLRRAIQLMSQQTGRMTRLVDDLLTLSRLESAQNPLREEDVNVPELVRTLHHEALAISAGRHRIRLRLDSSDWVKGGTEELRSAFGNLVSNAIRYTPEGGEIELRWENSGAHPVFAVRDTGIGIEPQHIERLTERFYRVDKSRSRETGGTGLGLAIVKHVLMRHQARLDVMSEPGKGSTFSVTFPDTRRLPPRSAAVAAASAKA